ncbi:MAG: N-acetyltransferase [Rhodobiaceae bacterium]|nr:N-acetyltransferase [Rhodobiaceae bacterium]
MTATVPAKPPSIVQSLPEGAVILPETEDHAEAVEVLNAFTFGPGRFAKTAYRLRRNNPPVIAYNRICMAHGRLVGAVCFSRVRIGTARALLLGPLAVHPDYKNKGIGIALMQAGMAAAQVAGERLVVLVGDAPYYARAGFSHVPRGQMEMPGPVDYARLLAHEFVPGSLAEARGMMRADPDTDMN